MLLQTSPPHLQSVLTKILITFHFLWQQPESHHMKYSRWVSFFLSVYGSQTKWVFFLKWNDNLFCVSRFLTLNNSSISRTNFPLTKTAELSTYRRSVHLLPFPYRLHTPKILEIMSSVRDEEQTLLKLITSWREVIVAAIMECWINLSFWLKDQIKDALYSSTCVIRRYCRLN